MNKKLQNNTNKRYSKIKKLYENKIILIKKN